MQLGLLIEAGSMGSGPQTGTHSMAMGAGPPSLSALAPFLVTWVVMMVAMMFPAVVPVAVTVHRWVVRTGRSWSATVLFLAGYLAVWTASGVVVFAAAVGLVPLLPEGEAALRLGAGVLVLAGAYQLTPLKDVCLRQCRSPLAFVAHHTTELRRGGLAGARVGAIHGLFCLGCCWTLMIVLVLLGMMSLAWMAAVAGAILLEKVLPRGWPVTWVVGLVLVGAGVALMASPHALPAFA